jgi:hypothetical protein
MGFSFLLANTLGTIRKKELTTLTKGRGEVKRGEGKAFTAEHAEYAERHSKS